MTMIRVQPEQLNMASQHMSEISDHIRHVAVDLRSALVELNENGYNGQFIPQVAARIGQGQNAVQGSSSRLNDLVTDLIRRAQLFAKADLSMVTGVNDISTMIKEWRVSKPVLQGWDILTGFPIDNINSWLNFGRKLISAMPLDVPIVISLIPPVLKAMPIYDSINWVGKTFAGIKLPWIHDIGGVPSIDLPTQSSDAQPSVQQQPQPLAAQESEQPSRGQIVISDPGMRSPWGQIDAPVKNVTEQRSADSYQAVIDQFDVEHSYGERYRPNDAYPDTRCNIYAGDVMRAMGVPLPTKGDLGHGAKGSEWTDPMTANAKDLNGWLREQHNGWHRVDLNNPDDVKKLHDFLRAGKPVLTSDPGHIAVVRPDHLPDTLASTNVKDLHIAQAGALNRNDVVLSDAGYGTVFNPDFFIHD